MPRRKCVIPDCRRFGRNKGLYKGKTRYDRVCEKHHKGASELYKSYFLARSQIKNLKCVICGWDKAPCDRHRLIPSKGYIRSNVRVLCPNCHRLVEMKLLKVI